MSSESGSLMSEREERCPVADLGGPVGGHGGGLCLPSMNCALPPLHDGAHVFTRNPFDERFVEGQIDWSRVEEGS